LNEQTPSLSSGAIAPCVHTISVRPRLVKQSNRVFLRNSRKTPRFAHSREASAGSESTARICRKFVSGTGIHLAVCMRLRRVEKIRWMRAVWSTVPPVTVMPDLPEFPFGSVGNGLGGVKWNDRSKRYFRYLPLRLPGPGPQNETSSQTVAAGCTV